MKIRLITAILLLSLILCACGEKPAADTTTTSPDTGDIAETTEQTAPAGDGFDFVNARIEGYVFANADGSEVEDPGYVEGGTLVSSHPSVAAVTDGAITPVAPGVTLIGYEGTDSCFLVCVLPEGQSPDMSAGTPSLLEVGSAAFVEGFGSADNFTVSDPSVIELDGATVRAVSPGYAVADVSNISMPKLFSYIVFDRNTD